MKAEEARTIAKNKTPRVPNPTVMAWIYNAIMDEAMQGHRARCFNKYSVAGSDDERSPILLELRENGYSVEEPEMQVIIRW